LIAFETENYMDHKCFMNSDICSGASFNYELWGELTLTEGLKRGCNDLAELTPRKRRASPEL